MSDQKPTNTYQSHTLKTEFEPVLRFFEVQPSGNLFRDVSTLATAIENAQINTKLTRYFFDHYDRDGNGKIDKTEFRTLMHDLSEAMGQSSNNNNSNNGSPFIDSEQIDQAMDMLDSNGNGYIEWREFKDWFDQIMAKVEVVDS